MIVKENKNLKATNTQRKIKRLVIKLGLIESS
jgi:hypothetical protein